MTSETFKDSPLLIDVTKTKYNNAIFHAMDSLKSERTRTDSAYASAMEHALGGNCVYIPHFLCAPDDTSIMEQLKSELMAHALEDGGGADGMVSWSKHKKHEDPTFSPTFLSICATMSAYFDVQVLASRLNYYEDGTQWKTFHKDSHAYGGANKEIKEDFTIGVSLGATRSLTFLHEDTDVKFSFPQKNGDVFAFSSEVNDRFMHGVPKASPNVGERFSVIVWGRRRTLNARNSSKGAKDVSQTTLETNLMSSVAKAMMSGSGVGYHKENVAESEGVLLQRQTSDSAAAAGGTGGMGSRNNSTNSEGKSEGKSVGGKKPRNRLQ